MQSFGTIFLWALAACTLWNGSLATSLRSGFMFLLDDPSPDSICVPELRSLLNDVVQTQNQGNTNTRESENEIKSKLETLEMKIGEEHAKLEGQLQGVGNKLEGRLQGLEGQLQQVQPKLEAHQTTMQAKLEDSLLAVKTKLEGQLLGVENKLEGHLQEVQTKVEAKLEKSLHELKTKLEGQLQGLQEGQTKLDGQQTKMETNLEDSLLAVKTKLEGQLLGVDNKLEGHLQEVQTKLVAKLDESLLAVLKKIEIQIQALVNQLQLVTNKIDSDVVKRQLQAISNKTASAPLQSDKVAVPALPTISIPSGFELIGSRYFRIVKEREEWQTAERRCREMGGYLASFRNEEEINAITPKLDSTRWGYWLGINDLDNEGHFVSVASHKPAPFLKWGVGEPKDSNHEKNCVILFNGRMWDVFCSTARFFICQADNEN
ncbi:hypothetical protein KR059_001935 [Drosophila kikkawai]|nr:hypothetical protein KR059_001935 [Drosophila kikkawai]